jgi:hypothetical protein
VRHAETLQADIAALRYQLVVGPDTAGVSVQLDIAEALLARARAFGEREADVALLVARWRL